MTEAAEAIRNSAKALILREGRVLMIRARDRDGDFYYLPGGGPLFRETMPDAVRRECVEEIGCAVEVGELALVYEYIHEKLTYDWQHTRHQIDFIFRCALPEGAEPTVGETPDDAQVGVEWVDLGELDRLRHFPAGLSRALRENAVYRGRGY